VPGANHPTDHKRQRDKRREAVTARSNRLFKQITDNQRVH
jgi:hypothetical protein